MRPFNIIKVGDFQSFCKYLLGLILGYVVKAILRSVHTVSRNMSDAYIEVLGQIRSELMHNLESGTFILFP